MSWTKCEPGRFCISRGGRIHSCCDECWVKMFGDAPALRATLAMRQDFACCFCAVEHRSGIYVQAPRDKTEEN